MISNLLLPFQPTLIISSIFIFNQLVSPGPGKGAQVPGGRERPGLGAGVLGALWPAVSLLSFP